jgi:hypothetical protein
MSDVPQPATHCACGAELILVPYAMDTWEDDVPVLGVHAGEPVAFCEAKCPVCDA